MRIRHKLILKIADDTEMKNLLFQTDETLSEVICDSLVKSVSGIVRTPADATDTLSLGDIVTAAGLYLRVNTACTLLINGTITLPIAPTDSAASFVKLFLEMPITSVTLTAGADIDVAGVWAMWGTPVT